MAGDARQEALANGARADLYYCYYDPEDGCLGGLRGRQDSVDRGELGKPLGGQAPFGYQWVDRQLVPHPEEPPIRKLMYELFSEHRRKKTVARILNKVGFSKLYHRKTPQTIKS